jgi:predicted ester cyclase
MNPTELSDYGTRYAQAWSSQDPQRVAEFFAEGGSLKVNDDAPAVGRAAITNVAQGFLTAFPDMVVTMDEIVPRADGAVFHWTFTGTNTGPGGRGRRVRFSGHEEWTFAADGLVAGSLGHFDAAEYAHQLEHGVDG